MKILFRNKRLERLCLDKKAANRELGANAAKGLMSRFADLEAATTVSDLVAGKPHPLKGNRSDQFSVTVYGGVSLTFSSVDDPIPKNEDGSIDWHSVTSIRIEFIGDYHD